MKNPSFAKLEDLPDVCTPQMAASYLGVSRQYIYELCQLTPALGGLPSYQIGKNRRIEKEDLLKWKEARRQEGADRFAQ
ncbi:helix-turn-helix domain-containing protein [Cohnella sp. 56]|uniref:helix-turn-helix domain-containing protein n=1 Tax=Cohnella sp. 56 TaxID=3113722 RepID=UPI0030E953F4